MNATIFLNYKVNGGRNNTRDPPLLKFGGKGDISLYFVCKLGEKDRLKGDFAREKIVFFIFLINIWEATHFGFIIFLINIG